MPRRERRSGVIEKAGRVLPSKRNPKGLGQAQMVEGFVTLSALGGECPEDFQTLRGDAGLEAMMGYSFPAPSTARSFLDRFHTGNATAPFAFTLTVMVPVFTTAAW